MLSPLDLGSQGLKEMHVCHDPVIQLLEFLSHSAVQLARFM